MSALLLVTRRTKHLTYYLGLTCDVTRVHDATNTFWRSQPRKFFLGRRCRRALCQADVQMTME